VVEKSKKNKVKKGACGLGKYLDYVWHGCTNSMYHATAY